MRALLTALLLAALGLALGALLRTGLAGRAPEIEVHWTVERRLAHGRILPGLAVAQGFVCEHDGLWRLEVRARPLASPPEHDLVLRLWQGGPPGEPGSLLVRRASADTATLRPAGGVLAFDFEPLLGSGGETYWLELVNDRADLASDTTVFTRQRAGLVPDRPWGAEVVTAPRSTLELVGAHAGLAGVAIAARRLDPERGAPRLTVRAEDGTVLVAPADAHLVPPVRVSAGWAVLRFAPLAQSRRARLALELEVPPGTVLAATEDGPSFLTLYGPPSASERLLGLRVGGRPAPDRDLVFRAWCTSPERHALATFRARAGARAWLALGAWLAATALVLALALRARARSPR